jgi:hypothetical protein
MKPPADCKELARRLVADAVPLHGRTYHDIRLAAAIIADIGDSFLGISEECVATFLSHDPTLYHTEPEDNR